MFLCSFALFGPPQAENFAIFRFLFTFLYVSGVISMVCERKIFQVLKNFTFFRIFQLEECKKIQKKLNKNSQINFKLCLDVGHGNLNSKNKKNFDPYFWLEEFAKVSPVLHIKQVVKNNFSHLPFTNTNNIKGLIKASKVLQILKKNNVKDTELSLELSFKERDPIDKNLKKEVLESVNYWKKYLNKN